MAVTDEIAVQDFCRRFFITPGVIGLFTCLPRKNA